MNSIAALAAIGNEITLNEIDQNAPIITELLDYLRWLADQDTGRKITAGQIWELFYEGVRVGRHWSDVCEDTDLPVRREW